MLESERRQHQQMPLLRTLCGRQRLRGEFIAMPCTLTQDCQVIFEARGRLIGS
jgi:hypothetical protein